LSPEKLIELAETLLDGDEASLRCAIHLSYYAIYHYCIDYFSINKNQERTHLLIREKLDKMSGTAHPPWIWKTRRTMSQLWTFRVRADYHLDKTIDRADAEQAVETAIIIRDTKNIQEP
jgi:hypothetical protein